MKNQTLLIAILLCPFLLLAQNDQTPTKHENVEWFWVIQVKFKIDKRAEAYEIIKNYWSPINSSIGTEQYGFQFETGEWDLIRVVKMPEGIATLEWELSPWNIQFNQEFLKLTGSEEAMLDVRKKWQECLQETRTEIAKRFNPD